MASIVIVDYGMGNLHSVSKAFEACGGNVFVSRKRGEILEADALVVPGVGAFGDCIRNLSRLGLVDALVNFIASGKPYLGLCLGLQVLLEGSEEAPGVKGLAVLPGRVRKFRGEMKIPHMGWNTINIMGRCPLFEGIEDRSYVYFVHSYYPAPDNAGIVAARTDYGISFASAVWTKNIMATQFHPEKSQQIGLIMIRNFIGMLQKPAIRNIRA